jgi:hypothetical protein
MDATDDAPVTIRPDASPAPNVKAGARHFGRLHKRPGRLERSSLYPHHRQSHAHAERWPGDRLVHGPGDVLRQLSDAAPALHLRLPLGDSDRNSLVDHNHSLQPADRLRHRTHPTDRATLGPGYCRSTRRICHDDQLRYRRPGWRRPSGIHHQLTPTASPNSDTIHCAATSSTSSTAATPTSATAAAASTSADAHAEPVAQPLLGRGSRPRVRAGGLRTPHRHAASNRTDRDADPASRLDAWWRFGRARALSRAPH